MKIESDGGQSEIGQLIKCYRERAGMTQKELSDLLSYPNPQFLSLIENGHSKVPLSIVGKLIEVLKIPEKKIVDCLVENYHQEINSILHTKIQTKVRKIGSRK